VVERKGPQALPSPPFASDFFPSALGLSGWPMLRGQFCALINDRTSTTDDKALQCLCSRTAAFTLGTDDQIQRNETDSSYYCPQLIRLIKNANI
jgi:hypothetical protein